MASASDSTRLPSTGGPVTHAIRAMSTDHEPNRRLALGVLLAAPAVIATPATAGPSDLARACDWAIARQAFLDNPASTKGWEDERFNVEDQPIRAVERRVVCEPAESIGDLAAKARFALMSFLAFSLPFRDQSEADLDAGERLIVAVLREVGAFRA